LRRLVLSFDCPFETLEQRLAQRAKSSDRPDDNPETMRKRFDTFTQQSKPVIEHYTQEGKCAHISAVDGPDEIFERVVAVLDGVLGK
jgi:adenylate kinase family enzyme